MTPNLNMYEIFRIWHSFYKGGEIIYDHSKKRDLINFLGGYKGKLENMSSWALTPEQEAKARLLLSPHARTIVKIYFHQHPNQPMPTLLKEVSNG